MTRMCVIGEADPFIARLLKRFAAESGLQTVVALVGQDVVELARHVKPVVIIVEAELPGTMRGWEAVRSLRADREICNIPVIICSWLQEADVRAPVDEVTGHLQKPELLYEDFAAALKTAPPAPRLRGGARFPPRLGGQGGGIFIRRGDGRGMAICPENGPPSPPTSGGARFPPRLGGQGGGIFIRRGDGRGMAICPEGGRRRGGLAVVAPLVGQHNWP